MSANTSSAEPVALRSITGTSIYTRLKCARAVQLDLREDRKKRREWTEAEEFVLKRGRDLEAEIVAELGYPEPEFAERDWPAGAAATEALLRSGIEGVSQGVLLGEARLGIPDLLRREAGASAFGDFHYVVGDIKSSGRARSDQVLQVAFYSRMLAQLQGREPQYGYLILKNGNEECFALADFDAALDQVEEEVLALRSGETSARPFFGSHCGRCPWSELCVPEMTAQDDLSLLQGMTPGLREVLERAGYADGRSLTEMVVEKVARKTRLEPTLLRRLKKVATTRLAEEVTLESRGGSDLRNGVYVHAITDGFADRVLCFGLLDREGNLHVELPSSRLEELSCFDRLIQKAPARSALLHHGGFLPRWHTDAAQNHAPTRNQPEARFVDVGKRLRGAVLFPEPAFGLADQVRIALQRDPHRAGDVNAAPLRVAAEGGAGWLRQKMQSDLEDLRDLVARLLPDCVEA